MLQASQFSIPCSGELGLRMCLAKDNSLLLSAICTTTSVYNGIIFFLERHLEEMKNINKAIYV